MPNPAHRPAADPANPRNRCLRVMVSPAEAEAIRQAAIAEAETTGRRPSVSDWLWRRLRPAIRRLLEE